MPALQGGYCSAVPKKNYEKTSKENRSSKEFFYTVFNDLSGSSG